MTPQEFGKYLKQLRVSLKLSIRQLSLYSGVSNSYISQIENGKRGIPTPDILKKLAPALKVPYSLLMQKAGYIDANSRRNQTGSHKDIQAKSSFGSRLRQLRLDRGLTQEELGKALNVTNVGVAKWESDDRFPDRDTLVKIADFFDVSLDYLLGRTDHPNATVHKTEVDGHDVEIGYDKEVYPDGLTHEQVIEILKSLKAAGFSFSPKEDSEKDS